MMTLKFASRKLQVIFLQTIRTLRRKDIRMPISISQYIKAGNISFPRTITPFVMQIYAEKVARFYLACIFQPTP